MIQFSSIFSVDLPTGLIIESAVVVDVIWVALERSEAVVISVTRVPSDLTELRADSVDFSEPSTLEDAADLTDSLCELELQGQARANGANLPVDRNFRSFLVALHQVTKFWNDLLHGSLKSAINRVNSFSSL